MPRDNARFFSIGFFACLFLLGGIMFVQAKITAPATQFNGAFAMDYFERCVDVTSRAYASTASEAKLDQLRAHCRQVAIEYATVPVQPQPAE